MIFINSSPPAAVSLGVFYIHNINATASNGAEVRYSLRFGPSGMNVDARTGVVGWYPDQQGEYDVEIRVELADDPSINITQQWKITVSNALAHPGCTGNEAWLPVERGLPGTGLAATRWGDDLYVLHRDGSPATHKVQLSKWNGSFWELVSTLDPSFVRDSMVGAKMVVYQDELYVSSGTEAWADLPAGSGLIKWDGTDWSAVAGQDLRQIADMEVLGNDLYVLGYHKVNDSWIQALTKWDGTDWEMIQDGDAAPEQWAYWGISMATLNDKLYVLALPRAMGIEFTELPLFELNNGTLQPVDNRQIPTEDVAHMDMIVHDGALYLLNRAYITRWDGTNIDRINITIPQEHYYIRPKMISYNGDLYLAVPKMPKVYPGNVNYEIWRFYDNQWLPVSALQTIITSDYQEISVDWIEYDGDLYSYGALNSSCGTALNNVAVLGTEGNNARIAGSVYHDDDRNCSVDPNEPKLAGELIEILPGPFYALTNDDGQFSTLLRPGTYALSVIPKRNWMTACPLPTDVTLASTAASVSDVNLGTDMIPGIFDIRSSLAVGRPRPGFEFRYTLTYWNAGTEPATGKLVLHYDNRIAYRSSTTAPTRGNNGVLEWDFANLPVGASVSITVTFIVPSTMDIGTELCASLDVELERKDEEEFLSDNHDSVCATVTGSYDPNDIQVAPVRFDEELENTPLLPGDTLLSYLVRFQNTGTDTAFTVVVSDTLDPNLLDIPSIRLGAASHDYDFDISGPGILTWTFKDILLPDSGANELASHGYFKYTVNLRRELPAMTEIPNRAAIYFDYNAPVITNTVVSITSGTLGVDEKESAAGALQLYPNPVHGISTISLHMTEREHVTLKLIDSRGTVLVVLNEGALNAGEQSFQLDGRSFAAGAYYLVLDRAGKKELYPVVITK